MESVYICLVELHIKKSLRYGNKGKKYVPKFEFWNQTWILYSMRGNLTCNIVAACPVLAILFWAQCALPYPYCDTNSLVTYHLKTSSVLNNVGLESILLLGNSGMHKLAFHGCPQIH